LDGGIETIGPRGSKASKQQTKGPPHWEGRPDRRGRELLTGGWGKGAGWVKNALGEGMPGAGGGFAEGGSRKRKLHDVVGVRKEPSKCRG